MVRHPFERIPSGLTETQRERMEQQLMQMSCMMVHWFADRAFKCPDSLDGTIETYRRLVVSHAHEGP